MFCAFVLVCGACSRTQAPASAVRTETPPLEPAIETEPLAAPEDTRAAQDTPPNSPNSRIARIETRFDARTLVAEPVTVLSTKQGPGPHGIAGIALVEGHALVITDRRLDAPEADAPRRLFSTRADELASGHAAFESLELRADGCCRENLEAISVGAGAVWLASDTGAVGKGTLVLSAGGAPSALEVRCSHVAAGGDCDAEGNDGLESIAVIAGRVLTIAEKPLPAADGAHPVLRVDFPQLVPIAALHVTGKGGASVRLSDAAGCPDALWLLGSYKLEGAYHSLLVRVPHVQGELGERAVAYALENPAYEGERYTPNLEAMAAIDDCKALLLANDDSSGNDVEYAASLLRRVTLPAQ